MRAILISIFLLSLASAVSANDALTLQTALSVICPIAGVTIGNAADRATWSVVYDPSCTSAERAQAAAVIASYDMTYVAPTSIAIVSTSTPSLSGSYAIDAASQQKVQAISLYVAVNGKFPAGQAMQAWPDASGVIHQFPTVAEWQAFATAMGDFVAEIDLGQNPAQPIAIP